VLGRVNWWAPRPLAQLYQRIGISESDEPSERSSHETPTTGIAVA